MEKKISDEDFSELINYVSMYDWISSSTSAALDPSEQEDLYNIDMVDSFDTALKDTYANPHPTQVHDFNLTPEELDMCMKLNINDSLIIDQPKSQGSLQFNSGNPNLDSMLYEFENIDVRMCADTTSTQVEEQTARKRTFQKLVTAIKSRLSNGETANSHATYVAQPMTEQVTLHISPEKNLLDEYLLNQSQNKASTELEFSDPVSTCEFAGYFTDPMQTQSVNSDHSLEIKKKTHHRNTSSTSWCSFSSMTSGYESTVGSCSNLSLDFLNDENLDSIVKEERGNSPETEGLISAPVDEIITTQRSSLQRVVANVADKKKRLKEKLQEKFRKQKAEDVNNANDIDLHSLSDNNDIKSPYSTQSLSSSNGTDNGNMDTLMELPKISNEKSIARKSGRDHRDVEKKYRDRIKRSTAVLKKLLTFKGHQKQSINDVLQGATEEIKRLRKKIDWLEKELQYMKQKEQINEISSFPSDQHLYNNEEEEWKQVQQASTVARQSARDGAKVATFTVLFLFSFVNPIALLSGESTAFEGDHTFHSRELMSEGEEIITPQHSAFSQLLRVGVSLLILMFMLLRGNIRCKPNTKIVQCFKSQLRKAQTMINEHNYEGAKNILRLSLLIIGDRCPRTPYGQIVSYIWKNICHLLYQASLMKVLETIGRLALPSGLLHPQERSERQHAAKLLMHAYQKLHEIALKDVSCTNLEADCYLMNVIHAAEVSGDHELLCTAYATAAVHMKEKAWLLSSFLQHYFADCADHQACLARQDSKVVVLEWIFDGKGYDYFTSGVWDLKKRPVFHTKDDNSKLDEADLLQTIFFQYQEFLLAESLKRIVIPEPSLRNDQDVEIGQSFLASLKSSSAIQKIDWSYMRIQSLYSWWVFVLKLLQRIEKNESVDELGETFQQKIHMLEQIDSYSTHEFVVAIKSVLSVYISILNARKMNSTHEYEAMEAKIQSAAMLVKNLPRASQMVGTVNAKDLELQELISIACYTVIIETRYIHWLMNCHGNITEKELVILLHEQENLKTFCSGNPHVSAKVKRYATIIEEMSGMNNAEIHRLTKRREFMISTCRQQKPRIVCVNC